MPPVQIDALMPHAASEMVIDCVPAKKGFGRLHVALRAEPEVNRLTDALSRPIQVNPPANLRWISSTRHDCTAAMPKRFQRAMNSGA